MNLTQIPAKTISYSGTRSLSSILAIVLHYTANNGDTAINEGNFFKNVNTRAAGAHFFVDQSGAVVQSISLDKIANAVGGSRYTDYKATGGATYYLTYNNRNTISIEMCDIANKEPSTAMINSVKELIRMIQSQCPSARKIIYHIDINGKHCPWGKFANPQYRAEFLKKVDPNIIHLDKPKYIKGEKYTLLEPLQVYEDATINKPLNYKKMNDIAKAKDKNKDGKLDKGSTITVGKVIVKENGNQFVKCGSGYIKAYTKSTNKNHLKKV